MQMVACYIIYLQDGLISVTYWFNLTSLIKLVGSFRYIYAGARTYARTHHECSIHGLKNQHSSDKPKDLAYLSSSFQHQS